MTPTESQRCPTLPELNAAIDRLANARAGQIIHRNDAQEVQDFHKEQERAAQELINDLLNKLTTRGF